MASVTFLSFNTGRVPIGLIKLALASRLVTLYIAVSLYLAVSQDKADYCDDCVCVCVFPPNVFVSINTGTICPLLFVCPRTRCLVCAFRGRSVARAFTKPPIFHPHALMHVLISRSLARSLLCAPLTRALWATAFSIWTLLGAAKFPASEACWFFFLLLLFFKTKLVVQRAYLLRLCPKYRLSCALNHPASLLFFF